MLDQEEVELIQGAEGGDVGQGIRRVGVNLEGDVGMATPDRADGLQIPARGDLELDPAIALLDITVNLIEERTELVLDPKADA